MLRMFAIIFGVVMIIFGILGFLPDFAPDHLLFRTFKLLPFHNLFHLVAGIAALVCGMSSRSAAKVFFIAVGLLLATLVALSFSQGADFLFANKATQWLWAGLGTLSLYCGFLVRG